MLDEKEIGIVYRAFESEGGMFGPLCLLLLLTGQRRAEVAGMRWDEVRGLETDEPIWEIPAGRTKNGYQHIVPLSSPVVELLNRLPRHSALVFTSTGATPLSGFSKLKIRIDRWIAAQRKKSALPPLPPWTLHDLRRTMVTVMNERLAIPPHVVEAVVNHLSGPAKRGVAGVYNRALYLDDRRTALFLWGEHVARLAQQGT